MIDITDEVATRVAAAGDGTCGRFFHHTMCAHQHIVLVEFEAPRGRTIEIEVTPCVPR